MSLLFSKYQGAGNDFILVDDRFPSYALDTLVIRKMCHRRYGIGADGVIVLCPSSQHHYKMRIFNADGSEVEMCGNGLRCLIRFIQDLGAEQGPWQIETMNSVYTCRVDTKGKVAIDMGEPVIRSASGPEYYIDVGVPHFVIFTRDLSRFDQEAKATFSRLGININYVRLEADGHLSMRTFERGVGETFSCGTGASAACAAAAHFFGISGIIDVKFVKDNVKLSVNVIMDNNKVKQLCMSGDTSHVYSGEWK